MAEPSGASWVSKYADSNKVEDLEADFKATFEAFLKALKDAGATVTIDQTYRPRERAYLMHWCYQVANTTDPETVPAMDGVDIDWVHRAQDGTVDLVASKRAAATMKRLFAIVYKPSLTSNHVAKKAVDMSIRWAGDLKIKNKDGKDVTITSEPRNGENTELHAVGKSYGVIKKTDDPPHWSHNGH